MTRLRAGALATMLSILAALLAPAAALAAAPVAGDDAYQVDEDAVLNVNQENEGLLANDSDADNDEIDAVLVTEPAHGTVDMFDLDGTFRYRPTANYNGTDTFTYLATDGTEQSEPATVSITVSAVNDIPVAVGESYSTPEDTALVVSAPGVLGNDTDVDGQTLTAAAVGQPANGTLNLSSNGGFTYTPDANYSGPDSFTYRANDGTADSNTVTVSLTITPVGDPPTANNDSGSTNEDTALVVGAPGVLGNDVDPDGSGLTANVVTGPAHGTLTLNANGSYTYTPAANFNGADSFTYRALSGSTPSNTATVSLTVNAVNDAPVAVADVGSTPEDTQLVVVAPGLRANDTDVDTALASLVASVVSQPGHGTVVVNANGSYTYTPAANYAGADSFTYRVFDGALFSTAGTVSLTVTPVNDAPVAVADSRTTNEDVVLNGATVLGNDTDVDTGTVLQAVLDTSPARGTLVLNANGTFNYTPQANDNGSVNFTYHATDGTLSSSTVTVTITVNAVNDAPTFALGLDPTVLEDSGNASYASFLTGISPGPANEAGQTAAVVLPLTVGNAALFATQPSIGTTGTLTFRPAANRTGSSQVTVNVADDGGTATGGDDTGTRSFTITVSGANDPPIAADDPEPPAESYPIQAGVLTPLDVLANDTTLPDVGETMTIVSATKPGHGTVTIATGGTGLSYRSTTGYAGDDTFRYTISDGLNTATADVYVTVVDSLPPVLGAASFRFDTGATLTASTVRVKLAWSAADPGSGVKSYDVQQSTNGGASWSTIYSATTATGATRSLTLKTTYTYRFRARDKGNRLSGWSPLTTFTPRRYQETTSLATYPAGWKTASIDSASGDHTKYSKTKGALATFTFTGRAVSLVAPRSSSRGKADIRVDGVLVATVNLYHSTKQARRHVWSRSWSTVGPHVVSVTVRGTTGHPRFDIDAWTVLD